MFHFSNFGAFNGELRAVADLDGYVPEDGDYPAQFNWPAGYMDDWEEGPELWDDYVAQCESLKSDAQEALDSWRDEVYDEDPA